MADAFGPIRWFDWDAVQRYQGGNLPHHEIPGAVYSVSFRLWDSLPGEVLERLSLAREAFLRVNPSPHDEAQLRELKRIYSAPLERYLDAGLGGCVLRRPEVRQCLQEVLHHYDGEQYQLGDYVIMPNHVHLLLRVRLDLKMRRVCRDRKYRSAVEINKLVGRTGRLWEPEPFDHIVRDGMQLSQCRKYIADNPRGLAGTDYTLGCGCFRWRAADSTLAEGDLGAKLADGGGEGRRVGE